MCECLIYAGIANSQEQERSKAKSLTNILSEYVSMKAAGMTASVHLRALSSFLVSHRMFVLCVYVSVAVCTRVFMH